MVTKTCAPSPLPPRVLVYVAAAAALLLAIAVGVGATAALMFASDKGSPEGTKPQQAEEAKPEQASKQEGASDQQSEAEYLGEIGDIQNGAVEASLGSNAKLLHYDLLAGAILALGVAAGLRLGLYTSSSRIGRGLTRRLDRE
jgi:hypothetical protein